jgi:hypothetical protein
MDIDANHTIYPNDFDVAFAASLSPTLHEQLGEAAWPWLKLWTAQHPGRPPSKNEVESLAVLTGAAEAQITAWMEQHIRTSCPTPSDMGETSMPSKTYRPKCIDSRWRYRYRGRQEETAKTFECTHRCGQSFPRQRKGDWARHERVNFEEWICPVCRGVLSRREKLRDHLRDFHGSRDAVQESHRRLTLCASQRPCGFCQRRLGSWSEWLAHVGAHFEGHLPGGERTMAEWEDGSSPSDGGMDMDMDVGDADSTNCTSELSSCFTNTTNTTTTTTTDSGFFSYDAASMTGSDNHAYSTLRQSRTFARRSISGRIAPPILENPRPDIYNAPDPTAGQPYAFPDPENQWSLQTMQSLLGCWTDGQT